MARFVEEEQRLGSMRPGPWQMAEADPPAFIPVPAEIMKDRERTAKVTHLSSTLPAPRLRASPHPLNLTGAVSAGYLCFIVFRTTLSLEVETDTITAVGHKLQAWPPNSFCF